MFGKPGAERHGGVGLPELGGSKRATSGLTTSERVAELLGDPSSGCQDRYKVLLCKLILRWSPFAGQESGRLKRESGPVPMPLPIRRECPM